MRFKPGPSPRAPRARQLHLFGERRPRRPRWSARTTELLYLTVLDALRIEGDAELARVGIEASRICTWLGLMTAWHDGKRQRPRLTCRLARALWAAVRWLAAQKKRPAWISARALRDLKEWAKRLYAWARWDG